MMSSDENGRYEFEFEESFSEIWYETPALVAEIQIGVSDTVELKEKL